YWGENGFFRIVRGINNLGIEADCTFVDPEIGEEDLVWDKSPAYGGSIWGIRPYNKVKAVEHPILDSGDVTSFNQPGSLDVQRIRVVLLLGVEDQLTCD
ncbi:hypothetical protein DYB26_005121, partial [Aphanomyces astaci]